MLQSASGITKCDMSFLSSASGIRNCDRSLLQSASGVTKCGRLLLQSVSSITKCKSYYKMRRNKVTNTSSQSGFYRVDYNIFVLRKISCQYDEIMQYVVSF